MLAVDGVLQRFLADQSSGEGEYLYDDGSDRWHGQSWGIDPGAS